MYMSNKNKDKQKEQEPQVGADAAKTTSGNNAPDLGQGARPERDRRDTENPDRDADLKDPNAEDFDEKEPGEDDLGEVDEDKLLNEGGGGDTDPNTGKGD